MPFLRLRRHRVAGLQVESSHHLHPGHDQRAIPGGRRFDYLRNGCLLQRLSRVSGDELDCFFDEYLKQSIDYYCHKKQWLWQVTSSNPNRSLCLILDSNFKFRHKFCCIRYDFLRQFSILLNYLTQFVYCCLSIL